MQGPAPLDPSLTYRCYDPQDQLSSCELKIDGQTFASAADQKSLLPDDYHYPDFYRAALSTSGKHIIEILGKTKDGENASANVTLTIAPAVNQPPFVDLKLINESQGPAPFYPHFNYWCYDPEKKNVSCHMKLDGRVFAQEEDVEPVLFPDHFTLPDFYDRAVSVMGAHTLEIDATDPEGLTASKKVEFTVLKGLALEEEGWYTCNNVSNAPCDVYQQSYCDKFTPTDLDVRRAAADAIAPHPGPFSVNQILDVYDYVNKNVFYQNVPVNLTYQPYSPVETLATKSGDCKNHAVLIASMVEAIGGSARVLLVPGCSHAFAEVYVGDKKDADALSQAVFSHYNNEHMRVNWHGDENNSQAWFIMDTAGGSYPGDTIPGCFNASQTFVMYDCNRERVLKAPAINNIEYGPFELDKREQVVDAGYWNYWYYRNGAQYRTCKYNITVQSLSGKPFSWYVIPESDYNAFENEESYRAYYREEQVQQGSYQLIWDSSTSNFRTIVYNKGDSPITVQVHLVSTCYD
jgi:hypothetical protein